MNRTPQSLRSLPVILTTLALVTGCVSTETANVGETHWHCEDSVKLTANKADRTGVVTFGGTKYDTIFVIRGLENIWLWGPENDYQIHMGINEFGHVRYYDFSGSKPGEKIKPRNVFACYTKSDIMEESVNSFLNGMAAGFSHNDCSRCSTNSPNCWANTDCTGECSPYCRK